MKPAPSLLALVPALILAAAAVPAFSQIRIACIGNSITDHSHNQDAYPVKLNGYLGSGYSVENDGVSGCTLLKKGNKPYWTQGRLPQVFAFKPHIVTIKLGTNDSKTATTALAENAEGPGAGEPWLKPMPTQAVPEDRVFDAGGRTLGAMGFGDEVTWKLLGGKSGSRASRLPR